MNDIIQDYESRLRFSGKAISTIKSYSNNLKSFLIYCQAKPTTDMVISYLDELLKKNIEKSTWNQIMYSIRFYFWITNKEFPLFIKKQKVRQKSKNIPLKEDIAKAIINTEELKEKAILLLFYDGWLRRSEAQILMTKDIDFSKNLIYVRAGKGNKDRVVWIKENTKWLFYYYLKSRPNKNNPYFINKNGSDKRYMSKKYLYSVVNQHDALWHPHLLRHAGATYYYIETGDLIGTSRKLGHEDITTTMIYLSLKREDLVMHKPSPYPLLINGRFAHNY